MILTKAFRAENNLHRRAPSQNPALAMLRRRTVVEAEFMELRDDGILTKSPPAVRIRDCSDSFAKDVLDGHETERLTLCGSAAAGRAESVKVV